MKEIILNALLIYRVEPGFLVFSRQYVLYNITNFIPRPMNSTFEYHKRLSQRGTDIHLSMKGNNQVCTDAQLK